MKRVIDIKDVILPLFNSDTCSHYFRKIFKRTVNHVFTLPSWIPEFPEPTRCVFNSSMATYQEITRTVRRMKAGKSPCPLDQISVIVLKRCPYLRTYLGAIFQKVWLTKQISCAWKAATTILIHKNRVASDPGNFRPITLQPICLKVFTSVLRNRLFEFVKNNNYIECCIQKGFVPKMSGTFEHTALLAHLIRDAKLKQKSIVITLLDLKNAFGEVQHNLIHTILKYHHVPDSFTSIVKNLYDGFHTSITTKDYATPFLRIEKGVLQGDCLSPLLFNLCMNSFIQSIKTRELEQLSYRSSKLLMPRHWLQFADDAVPVSATESENQTLVNAFCRWCNWAKMTIRPDKCHSFAMKKFKTLVKQYKPKIYVNNKPINAIEENESFKYLGRWFSFSMDNCEHRKELRETLENKLNIIHKLPLNPKNKLWLYSNNLIPKLCWNLKIADIDITWIKQNLDLLCHNYFRRWLNIPAAGTVEILQLSKTKFGMELLDISSKFTLCQISIRQCLKKSLNSDIHNLFKGTSEKNIQYDTFSTAKEALKSIRSQKENTVKNLQVQGLVIKELWNCAVPSAREYWFKAQHMLPRNIYNYTVRYMNDTLPSLSNLFSDYFILQCTTIDTGSEIPRDAPGALSMISDFVISEEKILNIIRLLNPNKAHGWDEISIRMIKLSDASLVTPLKIIFTNCLRQGVFPEIWKCANVVPVHKKNEKNVKSNYRPISLLPIFGKILEKLMYDSLYSHFVSCNLLSPNQSGFRPGDSTVNQLISITHAIFKAFACNPPLDVRFVYLDISKAFDRV